MVEDKKLSFFLIEEQIDGILTMEHIDYSVIAVKKGKKNWMGSSLVHTVLVHPPNPQDRTTWLGAQDVLDRFWELLELSGLLAAAVVVASAP